MNQAIATELTFHYLDGRNESFTIYEPIQPSVSANSQATSSQSAAPQTANNQDNAQDPFQHHVRHLLGKDWWVLHLPEKSVLINMDTVVKVEINPPLSPQTDDLVAQIDSVSEKLINAMQDI